MVAPSSISSKTDYHPAFTLQLRPAIELTDEQFIEICQLNRDLRFERTSGGELEIMSPVFSKTGAINFRLALFIGNWAIKDETGVAFDSSTGFKLPNHAIRSPDVSWIRKDRLAQLTPAQKQKFWQICPDFVIELRSSSDSLRKLQNKMKEYIKNGAQLGWLIDPEERQVFVYRPSQTAEHLKNPTTLSGEPLLPGFALDLKDVWESDF